MTLPSSSSTSAPSSGSADSDPPLSSDRRPATGLTPRAIILLILLTILCAFWVVGSEVVTATCLVGESVPAIPALGCLLFLAGVSQFLRRRGSRLGLQPREILTIYAGLVITAPMASYGGLQFFMQNVSALYYYAPSHKPFQQYQEALPSWTMPRDPELYRKMHEGDSETPAVWSGWRRIPLVGRSLEAGIRDAKRVPWGAWGGPLLVWGGFFVVLFGTTLCLALAFYPRWTHHERLGYPLVEMALRLTDESGNAAGRSLFRSRWMWTGFAIAAVFNITNFWHAADPNFPALGMSTELAPQLTEKPWNAITRLTVRWDPALIGLGCLVSRELLFSTWAWVAIFKLEAVWAVARGLDIPGMPFVEEQAQGAYLAIAALLLWTLLRTRGRRAVGSQASGSGESLLLPRKTALAGALIGTFALCLFANRVGMAPWLALPFFAMVLANAIVFTRIQAETGAPMIWLFPFFQPKLLLMHGLGSKFVMDHGGFGNLAALGLLTFVAVGYQPQAMAWQLSNFTLAERSGRGRQGERSGAWGIPPAAMLLAMGIALVVGLAASWYALLTLYYKYGANVCRHMNDLSSAWMQVQRWSAAEPRPDLHRIQAAGVGAAISAVTIALRTRFISFPFHPLGFAVAATHGDVLWAPFFMAWVLKGALLRLGGVKFYREAVPLFMGLAIGHFFMAGVVWSLIALLNGSAPGGYIVYFG